MDQLPSFGKAISQIVMPTFKAYAPLLVANASAIKSTQTATFQYGPDPRHNLDVYYPPSSPTAAAATSNPILVFLYGGGLVRGDKIHPAIPQGLAHANIAHFFASKYGYTVVIPDYRLVPNGATFPSGGEDLELVVQWMHSNLVGGSSTSTRELYMMGNSAGGIHLTTYLFTPRFQASRETILAGTGLRLTNVVELSVPFHFQNADSSRRDVLDTFYGADVGKNCPFGLLKAVVEGGGVAKLLPNVRFLVLTGSLDPEDEILGPNQDFVGLWRTQGDSVEGELQVEIMEGHNHISPPFSLGTGKQNEEAWGDQVADFCSSGAK